MSKTENFIKQTATTTGTGSFTLAAATGWRDMATAFGTGSGNKFYYFIRHAAAAEWEIGEGYMSDSTTLVRSTVLYSSNSNSAVNFSGGAKDIYSDIPAEFQNRAMRGQMPVRDISGNTTMTLADVGGGVIHPSTDASTRTATIDSNANLPLPKGSAYFFSNEYGAGNLEVAITSDTIRFGTQGSTGTRTIAPGGWAIAVKIDTTDWQLNGVGIT